MKLLVRPPRDSEWPICRMLLPETFAGFPGREYRLCVRDEAPHIVAAASFRHGTDGMTRLRLHVVPSFRRRGVGSELVEQLARGGACAMEGTVEVTTETAAAAFCVRNGFERVDSLATVEGEIAAMRDHMRRLRGRLTMPPGARAVPLRAAPIEQVARLHARHVAHEDELNPWRAQLAHTPAMGRSRVAMVDGRVVGILLWELESGTAVVRSRVVDPAYQGGWVNATLLADGIDAGWDIGVRRVRFSHTDPNQDTRKLAARLGARVVSVVTRFLRRAVS